MTIERSFVRHVGGWIAINQMSMTNDGLATLHRHFAPLFVAKGSEMLHMFLRRDSHNLYSIERALVDEFVATRQINNISLTGFVAPGGDIDACLVMHYSNRAGYDEHWFRNLISSTRDQRDAAYRDALNAQRTTFEASIRKPA